MIFINVDTSLEETRSLVENVELCCDLALVQSLGANVLTLLIIEVFATYIHVECTEYACRAQEHKWMPYRYIHKYARILSYSPD